MYYLIELWDDFINLLFPRLCYGCGNHLVRNEKLICTECIVVIPRSNYHLEPENPVEKLFWGRCRIERGAAFSFYNKNSRIAKMIHSLKYKGIREIGSELGSLYGSTLLNTSFLEGIDVIIPVPLHKSKERKRGFNQSLEISRGISESIGIPVDSTSLRRVASRETQTKRSRFSRWQNVEGIFKVVNPHQIEGLHILLIDDVITTGSTLEACCNELLAVEGVKVSVASLAVSIG